MAKRNKGKKQGTKATAPKSNKVLESAEKQADKMADKISEEADKIEAAIDSSMPKLKYIFWGLLGISALGMMISSHWFGLSGDEPYANGMGKAAWKFIKSFGQDDSIFHQPDSVNRDGVLTYYGNIFDIICIWLNAILPWEEYTTRHIFNAFVGWLGIMYSARIAQRYWGYIPAIICTLLMLFYPYYFGHAMNNPKDVPMAAFYIMGIFYSLRFIDRYPRLKYSDYLWLILAIILAIDVRVSGILLITYLPILVILHWSKFREIKEEKGWFKTFLPIAIVALAGYLGASIFWPYAALNPIMNPLNALSFLSDFKVQLGQIWEGAKIPSGELPGNYLIRSIFITSPWVFIIGLILTSIAFLSKLKSYQNYKIFLFLAFVSIFPLMYIMYKGSNVYHLWRHVIFVFPAFAILASLGYSSVSSWIKNSKLNIGLILFLLLLIEPISFTAKTFPNNVNYFNSSVGGIEGAYGNYEVDFYYNSMKPCVDYFENVIVPEHQGDTIILATNGNHLMGEYLKDKYPTVKSIYVRYPEKNQSDWDYGIFHIALVPLQEIQNRLYGSYNNPIYVNSIEDLPLCILYKRPSKADVQCFADLDSNRVVPAFNACQEYLKADPNNPLMKDIYLRITDFMKKNQVALP